jgi:outer membrane lipoprotein-sorting protein
MSKWIATALLFYAVLAHSASAPAAVAIAPATKEQRALLEAYQKRMVGAGQLRAKVTRKTLIGLLGTEKRAEGSLLLSKGRVRIDLKTAETDERQLLIVGNKKFWATTYPPVTLKDAAIQVVTGPIKSKKSGSQGVLALLAKDGFLKSFTVSGVALAEGGEMSYYLQPKQDWVEAKRALLSLVPLKKGSKPNLADASQWAVGEMKIWDFQDNETTYFLKDVVIEKKSPADKEFEFTPPKNADVMPVGV